MTIEMNEDKIPLELLVGLLSLDWDLNLPSIPKTAPQEAENSLITLNRELLKVKKHGDVSISQVQELARRTWIATNAAEKRIKHLEHELDRLKNVKSKVWKSFDSVLTPLWSFDEVLVPVHDALAEIYEELEYLRDAPLDELDPASRSKRLVKLQERLHEIEESSFRNGKIAPLHSGKAIPQGQALCVNLLSRCYHLVHQLVEQEPEIDESLFQLYCKMNDIRQQLTCMVELGIDGYAINQRDLKRCQGKMNAIENRMVDGKFKSKHDPAPQGQAQLRELMEANYELIRQCQLIDEQNESVEWNQEVEALIDLRDKLWRKDFTIETLHKLLDPLAETVTKVKRVASDTSNQIYSVLQSILWQTRRVAAQLEPIDPSLSGIEGELFEILGKLKKMERTKPDMTELEAIHTKLNEIEKRKVQGKFVNLKGEAPLGQLALQSLCDESFCLVIRMMDEIASKENK